MTVVVDSREDFTLEHFRRVALEGESVRIGPRALERMESTRDSFVALLDSDRTAFIYGTTTRPGIEVGKALAPDEQRGYASTLRGSWSPSFGGGGVLEEHVARGIVFARLANFVEGNAKTRPVIAERIAALLDGPLPTLPLGGHVAAGEILTLAPLMNALEGDFEEGETMALVNGSPCAAALAADVALSARERLNAAERVFALSVEAFGAPLDAYDEALEALWEDEHEIAALRGLRGQLEGAVGTDRLDHQAPVSYRILPRVLGQAHRAVGAIEHAASVSLRSVTDNPVYIPPDERASAGPGDLDRRLPQRHRRSGDEHALGGLGRPDLPRRAPRHRDARRRDERAAAAAGAPGRRRRQDEPPRLGGRELPRGRAHGRLGDPAAGGRRRRAERRRRADVPRLPQGAVRRRLPGFGARAPRRQLEPGAVGDRPLSGSSAPAASRPRAGALSAGRRSLRADGSARSSGAWRRRSERPPARARAGLA